MIMLQEINFYHSVEVIIVSSYFTINFAVKYFDLFSPR